MVAESLSMVSNLHPIAPPRGHFVEHLADSARSFQCGDSAGEVRQIIPSFWTKARLFAFRGPSCVLSNALIKCIELRPPSKSMEIRNLCLGTKRSSDVSMGGVVKSTLNSKWWIE
jgi:hypothetical protein